MNKKTPITDAFVRKVSIAQRQILIEHIDGAVPVVRGDQCRTQTTNALLANGLLRDASHCGVGSSRPRETLLTERGRETVARVLAEYADALSKVMELADAEIRPLQMLQRLKQMRAATRWTVPPEEPEEADSASPEG
jgi:hypothetical protein